MRVILLGATGNLGLCLIPALIAHKHHVTVYVRSISKLKSLISAALTEAIVIVCGDATNSAAVKNAILENACDAVVDMAGNQVLPWKEHLLPKIVKAVADAAVAVGQERGRPMRAWFIGGMGLLQYPGTKYLLQDYLPKVSWEQHQGTCDVLEAIPQYSLRWSLLCVAIMIPASPRIELLESPRTHNLTLAGGIPPEWKDSWVRHVPLVGEFFNLLMAVPAYTTDLEDVANLLAKDLETKGSPWEGIKVGMKRKEKVA